MQKKLLQDAFSPIEAVAIFCHCIGSATGRKLLRYIAVLLLSLVGIMVAMLLVTQPAHAASRLKDVVNVEGVRENILIGYGLVVGLNGTGDKLNNTSFTEKSLQAFLERLGVNTRGDALKTKNIAAVTVTASLPPFARTGSRIDVTVSTLGDAKSLQGGVLLATPLLGADGEVYAVAQGALASGGFSAEAASGSSVTKGVPTSGYISAGAIVEKEVPFDFNTLSTVKLALRNPDISTANRITEVINTEFKSPMAVTRDPGTVELTVPMEYRNNVSNLLGQVEQLKVTPDSVAKVVIDEASGTIVMGENVRISTVAVAQGNLVVRIEENPAVSQPGAFAPAGAQTVVVPQSKIDVEENKGKKFAVMPSGTTLRELVAGLNALGIGPRDMISILQTIKASGAMQAELETRG
jgi:flagellar P-ring protein precursor FlgI